MERANSPSEIGLSEDRMDRITNILETQVEKGRFPGAVMLLARHGKIGYAHSVGRLLPDRSEPMPQGAIFRIMSMTKPLTSLAAMMLVEQCALHLSDPITEFFPEFSDLCVAKPNADGTMGCEPARRIPTVHDLLRHTAGFSNPRSGTSQIKRAYAEANLDDTTLTNQEFKSKLAALPLEHQPGETWCYSLGTDLLGCLIEKLTGKSLDQVFVDMITGPLGMTDTSYWVNRTETGRIAEPFEHHISNLQDPRKRPTRFRGAAGLCSTASDYLRLCQFFLNKGELDGTRLVSRKTIELMTCNHIPATTRFDQDSMIRFFGPPKPGFGAGFGLGFAVRTSMGDAPWHGSVGAYEWAGAAGTMFLVDPKEDLCAVLMTQAPDQTGKNMSLLRALCYQTIAD